MGVSRRKALGRLLGLAAAGMLAWGPPQAPAQAQSGDIVVFAAASLKNALDGINAQWQKDTGKKAAISYAASPALAKQIEQARTGADVHLGRSRLDGLRGAEEPDQAGHALQPARQPHRADRAQGQGAGDRDQAGLRSRQGARRRTLVDGQRRFGPGRQVRQGGAREARRVGQRLRTRSRRPRTCARRCCSCRAARRRSASSIRRTPRPIPTSRSSARSRRIRIRRSSIPSRLTANATHPDAAAFLDYIKSAKAKAAVRGAGLYGARRWPDVLARPPLNSGRRAWRSTASAPWTG